MEENKNKKPIKDRIKKTAKRLFWAFLFIAICGFIFVFLFLKFYEIDGLGNYRPKYRYAYDFDKYWHFSDYHKDLYYQGRFRDAYRQGKKYTYLDFLKKRLIDDFKEKHYIDPDDDSFNENISNSDENDDLEKEKEKEREKNYKELKQYYEINLYCSTANTMYCSYVTRKYNFLSNLSFLNKILPRKYQIRVYYKDVVPDYRIFKKHNSIPDIYNYAKKLASNPNLNILEQLKCAELFKTCDTYKDSKKLCVSLMEKTMSELFSFKKIELVRDTFRNYYYDDYHYNPWYDIYNSSKLIDFIYYYQNFGGDVSKLKKKFNEFIKLIYENAEKEYNEVGILRKEFDLKKEGLKKKEVKEKYDLIFEKLKDSRDKFEYLSDLEQLRNAYYITNFDVDSILIIESKKWAEKCNNLMNEFYDEKIDSYEWDDLVGVGGEEVEEKEKEEEKEEKEDGEEANEN